MFEYLTLLLTTVFIYLIAKKVCCDSMLSVVVTFVSLAMLTTYFDGGNYTEEYAMPLIAVSLYIFLGYFQDGETTKINIFVCGLCGGGVLMLRPNMAATWLVFPIFVIVDQVSKDRIKELLEETLTFVMGVAVAVIPFIIYLMSTDALREFMDIYLGFNMEYSASEGSFFAILRTVYLFTSPILIASVVIIFACIYNRKNLLFNTAYLLYIVLTMVVLSISGRGYIHYGMILIPLFAYPLAVWSKELKKDFLSYTMLLSVILVVGSTYYTYSMYKFLSCRVNGTEDVYVNEVVEYVTNNTLENEEVLVIGNEDIIYLKCDRLCASKYSYQVPITSVRTEIYDEFYDEITLNKPSVIIVPVENEDFYGLDNFLDSNHYIEVLTNEEYVVLQQKNEG